MAEHAVRGRIHEAAPALFRARCAGTAVPGPLCRDRCAGTAVPGPLCRFRYAGHTPLVG
jgi:hypothetical protein